MNNENERYKIGDFIKPFVGLLQYVNRNEYKPNNPESIFRRGGLLLFHLGIYFTLPVLIGTNAFEKYNSIEDKVLNVQNIDIESSDIRSRLE